MSFRRELERLRNLEYYSQRELEIRSEISDALKDTNHVNLWEKYCDYLTEQRTTMNCNQNAINLVESICKKIIPPGYHRNNINKNINNKNPKQK